MGVFQADDVTKVEPTNAHLVSHMLYKDSYLIGCVKWLISGISICLGWFMVFNVTFYNIYSYISWRSVLLLVETGVPVDIYRIILNVR